MTDDGEGLFQHLDTLLRDGKDPSHIEESVWAQYGREVAVLVLDSAGFSRVSQSHGIIHYLTRLVLMRNIVLPIVRQYGHCHVKFEADNAFAAFERVDDAVLAARDIHSAMREQGVMLTETEPFEVCIGIGFGRMLHARTHEGFFGEEMNFASKLGEDTAVGGETLLTTSAWRAASRDLVADFEPRRVSVSGVTLDYYRCPD